MPKQKFYTVRLSYVQKYTHTVVVKASSDKEARSTIINEFNNAGYLYEKTTECPDETSLSVRFTAPGAKSRLKESHQSLILLPEDAPENTDIFKT